VIDRSDDPWSSATIGDSTSGAFRETNYRPLKKVPAILATVQIVELPRQTCLIASISAAQTGRQVATQKYRRNGRESSSAHLDIFEGFTS